MKVVEINVEGLPRKILENIKIETGLKFSDRDENIMLNNIKDTLSDSEVISQEIPFLGMRCLR